MLLVTRRSLLPLVILIFMSSAPPTLSPQVVRPILPSSPVSSARPMEWFGNIATTCAAPLPPPSSVLPPGSILLSPVALPPPLRASSMSCTGVYVLLYPLFWSLTELLKSTRRKLDMLSLSHRYINGPLKHIPPRSLRTRLPQATQRPKEVDDGVMIAGMLLYSDQLTSQQPVYNAGRISRSYLDWYRTLDDRLPALRRKNLTWYDKSYLSLIEIERRGPAAIFSIFFGYYHGRCMRYWGAFAFCNPRNLQSPCWKHEALAKKSINTRILWLILYKSL